MTLDVLLALLLAFNGGMPPQPKPEPAPPVTAPCPPAAPRPLNIHQP